MASLVAYRMSQVDIRSMPSPITAPCTIAMMGKRVWYDVELQQVVSYGGGGAGSDSRVISRGSGGGSCWGHEDGWSGD